jgi:response regulator receiver domain-containing protein
MFPSCAQRIAAPTSSVFNSGLFFYNDCANSATSNARTLPSSSAGRVGVEGVDDVIADPRLLGRDDVLGLALGGDHDERQVFELAVGPHLFDMNVMVVDDYGTMRRILRSLLSQIGFKNIDEAADGGTGLSKLRDKPFGLVISDWNMDPMTGLQLLQEVATTFLPTG